MLLLQQRYMLPRLLPCMKSKVPATSLHSNSENCKFTDNAFRLGMTSLKRSLIGSNSSTAPTVNKRLREDDKSIERVSSPTIIIEPSSSQSSSSSSTASSTRNLYSYFKQQSVAPIVTACAVFHCQYCKFASTNKGGMNKLCLTNVN